MEFSTKPQRHHRVVFADSLFDTPDTASFCRTESSRDLLPLARSIGYRKFWLPKLFGGLGDSEIEDSDEEATEEEVTAIVPRSGYKAPCENK